MAEPAPIESSSAARGLYDLAAEALTYGTTSVLVIGSTHRGPVGRVLLGTVGELLVAGCPCPIAVAPRGFAERASGGVKRVMVGFDGSPESRAALAAGQLLANAAHAALNVVTVAHRGRRSRGSGRGACGPWPRRDRDRARGRSGRALGRRGRRRGLLVVGARGYGPHRHVMMGSVSSRLMRTSPAPVVVLPRPPERSTEAEQATASAGSA